MEDERAEQEKDQDEPVVTGHPADMRPPAATMPPLVRTMINLNHQKRIIE